MGDNLTLVGVVLDGGIKFGFNGGLLLFFISYCPQIVPSGIIM